VAARCPAFPLRWGGLVGACLEPRVVVGVVGAEVRVGHGGTFSWLPRFCPPRFRKLPMMGGPTLGRRDASGARSLRREGVHLKVFCYRLGSALASALWSPLTVGVCHRGRETRFFARAHLASGRRAGQRAKGTGDVTARTEPKGAGKSSQRTYIYIYIYKHHL